MGILAGVFALSVGSAQAAVFEVSLADFNLSPVLNNITQFTVKVDIATPLVAGQAYKAGGTTSVNMSINSMSYKIGGTLNDPTPSGFSAFLLERDITSNAEFVNQGSLFEFGISAAADLTDGLQVSEFQYFGLDAREFGTGRYHPFALGLSADGTGVLQNSANNGGVNPGSGQVVQVNYGDEYMIDLTLDPNLTLFSASSLVAVPLPSSVFLLGAGVLGLMGLRRRARRQMS